jgi:hypothetical protein
MPLPSIECPQVQWENGQSTLREGRSGDPTDKIADFCNKICHFPPFSPSSPSAVAIMTGQWLRWRSREARLAFNVELVAAPRAKDFEATIDSARAFLYAASVMLLVPRIARA